jgi:hypothetical protein
MAIPAITAIISGAMLFALGMMPGLIATLLEELQDFRDHFSSMSGPIRNRQTDSRVSGAIWLRVGGAVMMILGLLALLSS